MARETPEGAVRYSVSPEPLVENNAPAALEAGLPELPRSYGGPVLYAIARDPQTIFAYWDVDWSAVFGGEEPEDRKVHLRVLGPDGTIESSAAVEPAAANAYLRVSKPRTAYRLELGYYTAGRKWNAVAQSEKVETPPQGFADRTPVDLATVPYHLSFQRLIDLLDEEEEGETLTEKIAQLQERAAQENDGVALTASEASLLRVIGDLPNIVEAQRSFDQGTSFSEAMLEKLLGLGGTSPAEGLGGSSPG